MRALRFPLIAVCLAVLALFSTPSSAHATGYGRSGDEIDIELNAAVGRVSNALVEVSVARTQSAWSRAVSELGYRERSMPVQSGALLELGMALKELDAAVSKRAELPTPELMRGMTDKYHLLPRHGSMSLLRAVTKTFWPFLVSSGSMTVKLFALVTDNPELAAVAESLTDAAMLAFFPHMATILLRDVSLTNLFETDTEKALLIKFSMQQVVRGLTLELAKHPQVKSVLPLLRKEKYISNIFAQARKAYADHQALVCGGALGPQVRAISEAELQQQDNEQADEQESTSDRPETRKASLE